jgi:hypothetical protein
MKKKMLNRIVFLLLLCCGNCITLPAQNTQWAQYRTFSRKLDSVTAAKDTVAQMYYMERVLEIISYSTCPRASDTIYYSYPAEQERNDLYTFALKKGNFADAAREYKRAVWYYHYALRMKPSDLLLPEKIRVLQNNTGTK